MERRIQKKIDEHHTALLNKIKELTNDNSIKSILNNYQSCKLDKNDFIKRKRTKNNVDLSCRCCANRANGEQCTRRRKDGSQFCGTHIKSQPNGITDENPHTNKIQYKKEVWAQDINGIIFYLDKEYNVYKPEDIMANKTNPTILCKYKYNSETDRYSLIQ